MAELKGRINIGKGEKGDRGIPGPQGPRGYQGIQGPRGEVGPIGPVGPMGPIGPQGQVGPGIQFKGKINDESELPSKPQVQGDCYVKDSTKEVFVYNGKSWDNVGRIVGPQGPKGNDGAPGKTGAIGPQGPVGANGKDGKGLKFVTAKKSYNYAWWINHSTWTDNFLESDFTYENIVVGDIVSVSGSVSDKPGMKMILLGEVTEKGLNYINIKGKGLANLNDATGGGGSVDLQNYYTKGQSDARYPNYKNDETLEDMNTVRTGKFLFKHTTLNIPKELSGTYGVVEIIPKATGENRVLQRLTVIYASAGKYNGTIWTRNYSSTSSEQTTPWKQIATTDDLHGAKILKIDDNFDQGYSWFESQSTGKPATGIVPRWIVNQGVLDTLKRGDFIILTCAKKKLNIYAEYLETSGGVIRYNGLGMSSGEDAYSRTEADKKYYGKSDTVIPNLDEYKTEGYAYLADNTVTTSLPPQIKTKYAIVQYIKRGGNDGLQTLYSIAADTLGLKFERYLKGGSWTPWKQIATTYDMNLKTIEKVSSQDLNNWNSWATRQKNTVANTWISSSFVAKNELKANDIVIVSGKIKDQADKPILVFLKVKSVGETNFVVDGLGMSTSVDIKTHNATYTGSMTDTQWLAYKTNKKEDAWNIGNLGLKEEDIVIGDTIQIRGTASDNQNKYLLSGKVVWKDTTNVKLDTYGIIELSDGSKLLELETKIAELTKTIATLATKSELSNKADNSALNKLATKEELENEKKTLASKDELTSLAKKTELEAYAKKEELEKKLGKDEIELHPSSGRKGGKLNIPTNRDKIAIEWHEITENFGSGPHNNSAQIRLDTTMKEIDHIQLSAMASSGHDVWDLPTFQASVISHDLKTIQIMASKGGTHTVHLLVIGKAL